MRIASPLPSATERERALAARAERVGRSRESARRTFDRPGRRIVESLEILSGVSHPELTPTTGAHSP